MPRKGNIQIPTQEEMVLNHLKRHGKITSLEAFRDYGITRISARIFNLRKRGYKIETKDIQAVSRYGVPVTFGEYRIDAN